MITFKEFLLEGDPKSPARKEQMSAIEKEAEDTRSVKNPRRRKQSANRTAKRLGGGKNRIYDKKDYDKPGYMR